MPYRIQLVISAKVAVLFSKSVFSFKLGSEVGSEVGAEVGSEVGSDPKLFARRI